MHSDQLVCCTAVDPFDAVLAECVHEPSRDQVPAEVIDQAPNMPHCLRILDMNGCSGVGMQALHGLEILM